MASCVASTPCLLGEVVPLHIQVTTSRRHPRAAAATMRRRSPACPTVALPGAGRAAGSNALPDQPYVVLGHFDPHGVAAARAEPLTSNQSDALTRHHGGAARRAGAAGSNVRSPGRWGPSPGTSARPRVRSGSRVHALHAIGVRVQEQPHVVACLAARARPAPNAARRALSAAADRGRRAPHAPPRVRHRPGRRRAAARAHAR